MYYAKDTVEILKQSHQLVVFGAGVTALGVVACLREKPYELLIECCLVSDRKVNPAFVAGIPVIDFEGAEEILHKDATIVVAAIKENLAPIRKSLYEKGYSRVIEITYEGDLWCSLRGNLYQERCLAQQKPYLTLEEELKSISGTGGADNRTITVYTAKCHVDRELTEDVSRYDWETDIQVGAALTDERICEVCDNTGENISDKNRQYCELTALYWIWKNDHSDYVGLGHYRRHFKITEEQLRKLVASDIDVVLTIPIFDYPDVETVYRRDHVGRDWDVMCEAIKELAPKYQKTLEKMRQGQFYYAYNMFIMRREILEDYCAWLFPILSCCEERCGGERSTYQNRYIGFLAEHLLSLYFMHHEKEYKIVHAEKHFIEE